MDAIYFFIFCALNGVIIYWALRNDDQAAFYDNENNDEDKA